MNCYHKSLLGVALGDMMGLYYEGVSRYDIMKKEERFERPKLLFGRGMFSDDTEHSIIVAQCLIESLESSVKFEKTLRRRLQKWLFTLPAGVGFATLRGIIKSFFMRQSGVFSAGNAPAMRAHLIGLFYGDDDVMLQKFIKVNTYITHTNPKAYYGALVVAKATYLFSHHEEEKLLGWVEQNIQDRAFIELLQKVFTHQHIDTSEFAKILTLEEGVSGYIYHTLPIALHSAYYHKNNYRQAIIGVIKCGGDTDTVAAITGGIVGVKTEQFPTEWVESIMDYPINQEMIQKLSIQLDSVMQTQRVQKAKTSLWIVSFIRNIIFLCVVILSALRRLF
jgi:ADP-ribosylglycohydrolase